MRACVCMRACVHVHGALMCLCLFAHMHVYVTLYVCMLTVLMHQLLFFSLFYSIWIYSEGDLSQQLSLYDFLTFSAGHTASNLPQVFPEEAGSHMGSTGPQKHHHGLVAWQRGSGI